MRQQLAHPLGPAKYHPYIVELLRHHMIRGIKGGGYMPENNFSISDLDPQTRQQVIADKPELKGLLGITFPLIVISNSL